MGHLERMRARLSSIEALEAEERAVRDEIEAHWMAGRIALARMGEGSVARGAEALRGRVASLRLALEGNAADLAQFAALRVAAERMIDDAAAIAGGLVAMWKRHCLAALSLLSGVGGAAGFGAVAREMTEARNRVLAAISPAERA